MLHSVYGFLSCLKHWLPENNLQKRLEQLMDLVTYRLKGDAEAIVQDYVRKGRARRRSCSRRSPSAPGQFCGRLWVINYVKLHRLFTFNPGQERHRGRRTRTRRDDHQVTGARLGALVQTVDSMLRKGQEKTSSTTSSLRSGTPRAAPKLTPANPDGSAQV